MDAPSYLSSLTAGTIIMAATTEGMAMAVDTDTMIEVIIGDIIAGPGTTDRQEQLRFDAARCTIPVRAAVHLNSLSVSFGVKGYGLLSGAVNRDMNEAFYVNVHSV